MDLAQKRVLVIGAGVAGLSAAADLARLGCGVTLVEKESHVGGHAAQFTCKAAPDCVRCGACTVEDGLRRVQEEERIDLHTGSRVLSCSGPSPFAVALSGAPGEPLPLRADAIVLTTGFAPFKPDGKPYGWGQLPNVVTGLELERSLRRHGEARRPSDGKPPRNVAFIQCVGSRDASLGHSWCSMVCCASALRMAHLIQHRRPGTAVTFFYIDLQSFGRDFETFYAQARLQVRLVRAIPADILDNGDGRLKVTYFDTAAGAGAEEPFDLVSLSVGLLPGNDSTELAALLGIGTDMDGFLVSPPPERGVFLAGAATGPMGIAESIASAGRAVGQVASFLGGTP